MAGLEQKTPASGAMDFLAASSARGRRRGRTAYFSGIAAEDIVARRLESAGARVLDRRWRCPSGEIDVVAEDRGILPFVEVKQRKRSNGWDSPVSQAQWQRLEAAASQYIVKYRDDTGIQPICRFDVALVGHDGTAEIIENAWSCLM